MGIAVERVMTRDVLTLFPDMTLKQMDQALLERHVSGAPVVDGRRLVGVASRADALRALYEEQAQAARITDVYSSPYPIPLAALEELSKQSRKVAEHLATTRVRDIMTTDPLTARPGDDVEVVARVMASERVHRLPIVEDGELVGIVSALDLVRLVAERGLADAR